ncbi:MAG TPA: hypothetical protein VGV18_07715 [Verrucomicrobiae bacterium]|nr:hypothetical protein [Verrucomicrobiae bacterium]
MAILTVIVRRMRDHYQERLAAGQIVSSGVPMKPGTVAAVVAGGFLLFSWFICFERHDRTSVAITRAAMVLMALHAFFNAAEKPPWTSRAYLASV